MKSSPIEEIVIFYEVCVEKGGGKRKEKHEVRQTRIAKWTRLPVVKPQPCWLRFLRRVF
ncbi:hypothetical protein SAMN05421736_13317 [Evansella caseinilytica]|uniref:Uncharacterized protein n=1 Tax=Evansella caseinilytica TaxID=1503961 RepID=A0A1H3V0P1_9BACI|nr:hypothetical protein SAMN05421736_13317 [Evansella caseinilytica]